jgi:hypothetical protein
MRTITKWLPMTKAIEAMRGIFLKGKNSLTYIERIIYLFFFRLGH